MITIDDVARLAGVSPATVSRVMNGNYRLDTEKYRRVTEAMEQLGYTPRQRLAKARPAAVRTEYRVLAVVNVSFRTDSMMLASLERAAAALGLRLTQKIALSDSFFGDILQLAGEHDGVVLCDIDLTEEQLSALGERNGNLVFFRKQYPAVDGFSVMIDDAQAGYDAANYLISRGRKRILYLGHAAGDLTAHEAVFGIPYLAKRYGGYARACMEHRLEVLPPMLNGPIGYAESRQDSLLENLLSDPAARPDGVICQHPLVLYQLRHLAERFGFSIPGELEPIAFADSIPGDRTIALLLQPIEQMALAAMRALRLLLDGDLPAGRCGTLLLPHSIVEAIGIKQAALDRFLAR